MSLTKPAAFSHDKHAHLLPQIHDIHRDCILQDHQVLAFLPNEDDNIDEADLADYWLDQCQPRSGKSERELLLQLDEDGKEVFGFVMLDMPFTETGPFRGFVQKLMVSVHHRRKGVARNLLAYVETAAQKHGRYLLMLDTPVGLPAEQNNIFEKAGFVEIGVIPNFSISPGDGLLIGEKFFYKELRCQKQACNGNETNGHV